MCACVCVFAHVPVCRCLRECMCMFLHVCVCVRACVRASVRARVGVCVVGWGVGACV